MSNFVIHENVCCVCKTQKLVFNFQCDGTHTQPFLICEDCARIIADDIRGHIPQVDEDEEYLANRYELHDDYK